MTHLLVSLVAFVGHSLVDGSFYFGVALGAAVGIGGLKAFEKFVERQVTSILH